MKIGTLINNGVINDMTGSQVLITPQGMQVQQVQPAAAKPDEMCFDHLPEKLRSPRAQELWRELFKAGYVDSRCITTRSRTESAIMAKRMADKLGLTRYWNEFSDLWQMSNLKSAYGKCYESQNGWDFEEKMKHIFA